MAFTIPTGFSATGNQVNCPRCGGTGVIYVEVSGEQVGEECPYCGGTGAIPEIVKNS